MRKNDTALVAPWDLPVALALMTRLPMPRVPEIAFERQAQAAWAFPLVGLVVGLIAAVTGLCGLAIGLPVPIVAGLCVAVQIIVTGAMHEDGLADTVDGFWGGWEPERRLEIMKDSRIGTYGVLALVISVALRWVAVAGLLSIGVWALIVAAIASRAGLPIVMTALPRVRPGGLSDTVGTPGMLAAVISGVLGAILVVLLAQSAAPVLFLATILSVGAVALIAQQKIGGQTGDVLGATQQITEIACLIALASMI